MEYASNVVVVSWISKTKTYRSPGDSAPVLSTGVGGGSRHDDANEGEETIHNQSVTGAGVIDSTGY